MSKLVLLDQIDKKKFEKKNEKYFFDFFSIFKSVKSPASENENVRFPKSLDFKNLPDFGTGRDVR